MYCIEPEEILISIYKNGMLYEPHDQDVAEIFNIIFLCRTSAILRRIDYMEPKNLIPFHNVGGISHPDADLFWQEKDYPYILYCKHIQGWYAYLHLCGTDNTIPRTIDDELSDKLFELASMYRGIHSYRYDGICPLKGVTDELSDWFYRGVLPNEIKTRQDLYYPKHTIYYDEDEGSNWKFGRVAAIGHDALMNNILGALPSFLVPLLSDTCFVAGGFLSRLSIPERDVEEGDIDIWVVRGLDDGYTKLNSLIEEFKKHNYRITTNGSTISCHRYLQVIQLIPISYRSIMEIIDNFDTSCTSIAFNGKEIFASDNFKKYISKGISYCIRDIMLLSRYEKYNKIGFNVVLSDKTQLIDMSHDEKTVNLDKYLKNCFDINLFGSNNQDIEIPKTKYSNAFMTTIFLEEQCDKKIVKLCNRLTEQYIDNPYISHERYCVLKEKPWYSSIDHYLECYPRVSISIPRGLKNDLAVYIYINMKDWLRD